MNIKLIFFVCSGYNLNLMNAFFKHYRKFGVEDFFCVYHEIDDLSFENKKFIEKHSKIIHVFDDEYTLEKEIELKNHFKREVVSQENDWVFLVDADEFLDVTSDYIYNVVKSDANYLNAILIDHFSSNGIEGVKTGSPFKQFDVKTTFTRDVLNTSIHKIPLTRSYVPLEAGHQSVSNFVHNFFTDNILKPYNLEEKTFVNLAHFKWHSMLFDNIYEKLQISKGQYLLTQYECKFLLDYMYKNKSINELIKDCTIN